MSSVDDLLFEPIGTPVKGPIITGIDTQMVDAVRIALTGSSNIEFFIDNTGDIATYEAIADLVENDSQVLKYTRQMVAQVTAPNFTRPAGALTIKDVFRRLYNGQEEFWFTARLTSQGVTLNKFTNWFAIDGQIPILHLTDHTGGANFFEWWLVALMSNFVGYNGYYAFGTEAEARKYFGTTP
jgi:hypothetical protein